MYDTIRKDWATLFSNVHEEGVSSKLSEKVKLRDESPFDNGLGSPQNSRLWFVTVQLRGQRVPDRKVRNWRTKSGQKADPQQVSVDMRNARDTNNERKFSRHEWLSRMQIKGFFHVFRPPKEDNGRHRNS